MKIYVFIIMMIVSLLSVSCGEEKLYESLYSLDNAPGIVTNVKIENGPGNAKISYDLPNDKDIAYVKGVYTVNGVEKTIISSVSKNHLLVEGLPTAKEYSVSLVVYSNSNIGGESVETIINPSKPYYKMVGESVHIQSDFGGALIRWQNEMRNELLLIISAEDTTGLIDVVDYHQTTQSEGEYLLTGYEPEETTFSVQVRDEWSNLSDSTVVVTTPLYEQQLDGHLWTQVDQVNDYSGDVGGFEKLYDDKTISSGDMWLLEYRNSSFVPPYFSFTMDLGVSAVISRFHFFDRWGGDWGFNGGETEFFEVYGSNELSPNWDDWTDLTPKYVPQVVKPSGLPIGQNTNEDKEAAYAGFIFRCDASLGAFRYIRVRFIDNFGHKPYSFVLTELDFYGQIIED
ncbi:DUF4959 domain-containing protein [Puteibacter caeruleilacunae]|nr:DUF4959 domain-containing protein [Puteibacter caeruleilacunae]